MIDRPLSVGSTFHFSAHHTQSIFSISIILPDLKLGACLMNRGIEKVLLFRGALSRILLNLLQDVIPGKSLPLTGVISLNQSRCYNNALQGTLLPILCKLLHCISDSKHYCNLVFDFPVKQWETSTFTIQIIFVLQIMYVRPYVAKSVPDVTIFHIIRMKCFVF